MSSVNFNFIAEPQDKNYKSIRFLFYRHSMDGKHNPLSLVTRLSQFFNVAHRKKKQQQQQNRRARNIEKKTWEWAPGDEATIHSLNKRETQRYYIVYMYNLMHCHSNNCISHLCKFKLSDVVDIHEKHINLRVTTVQRETLATILIWQFGEFFQGH